MNVLITSASRKVSLVRAFQSALTRRGGGCVIAVDISPFAPALYVADRYFLVPRSTQPDLIGALARLCEREQVGLLVPTRDEELPLFAEARDRFERIGVRVLVPASETVRQCQDKCAFLDFCRRHNFGVPRTFTGDEWREAVFPLFVKPRFGKGARGARRIINETELRHALEAPDEWIVQECVTAPEYTVDLLADFQGRVISAVPRLRQFVLAGESYVSRTVNEPTLVEEAARLATELGLVGHNTIQCFWDGKQMKFIEVNPRFGGAAALGMAAGADTPFMLLQLLEGEAVPSRLGRYESDLVMLRFTDDLFLKKRTLDALTTWSSKAPPAKEPAHRLDARASMRAVLFDLDNTLYPEEEFVRSGFQAVAEFLAARSGLRSEEIFDRILELFQSRGRGRIFNTVLEQLKLDARQWLKPLLLVYRSHRPDIALFPEAEKVLKTLKNKGVRLGLVTDGMASVQKRKITALGLEQKLEVMVCTDELGPGCAKPSTVPFETALTLLGVPPECAAYVGDDPGKDFAGPNRLGMKSICVRSPGLIGVPRKVTLDAGFQPHVKIESLKDVLSLIPPEVHKRHAILH